MADRGMKALLVDEEAAGPSDRPMRLMRADEAGAPASSAGAGERASATAGARRGSTSTLAGTAPTMAAKPTMGTPPAVASGFGAAHPAHMGPSGGGGKGGSSYQGPTAATAPKPTMGLPAGGTHGLGTVHFTPVDATRNLLKVGHAPLASAGSPKPAMGTPAGGTPGHGAVHFTQVDATRNLLHGGHHPPTSSGSPKPTTGTHPGVVPGLGHGHHPSHVGAGVGLVHGLSHHALTTPHGDPTLTHIAHSAQHDPSRWGADLVLRGHNPRHYEELARAGRLPSHVWAHHDGRGRLGEHLRDVHARHGEELRWRHHHRPVGERALLGYAAATGVHDAVARALDAMRVHRHYPARASFGRLMVGFHQHEVARIASAFLVPGRDPRFVLGEYRGMRERLERAHTRRRRALLRRLRELWAGRGVTLVPMFASVTEGYSPAQIERLRFELARGGAIEATFEAIEQANLDARLASAQAAFHRWLTEWESSRRAGAQTPLQEPQTILLTTPAPTIQYVVNAPQVAPPAPVVATEPEEPEAEPVEDAAPDSTRRLVLEDSADDAEAEPADEKEPAEAPEEPSDREDAGALRVVRAPCPGAHAADGVLPWHHLTQGFRGRDEAELGRAWNEGRPWDAYRAILERTAAETTTAREAEFCRRVVGLGCEIHGPCHLPGEQLGALAHLGAHFAPEQWARLAGALTEGADDPLEVWRAIERENVAEAIAVREPAFLQHLSAWGAAPGRWNPVEWRHGAPHLRRAGFDEEASGLVGELDGALGGEGAGDGHSDAGSPDSTFSDEVAGDFGDLGSTLGGLTANIFGAGGAEGDLGGKLGSFARDAVGALHGTTPIRGAAWGSEASGQLDDASGAPAGGDLSALGSTLGTFATSALGAASLPDLERVVAQWGNNPLGRPIVQALLGIGLPDLASSPPSQLLRLLPQLFPQTNTDPNGWWGALTAGQGLDEAAQRALRATIDADGPGGIQHTIAAYQRLLQGPSDELRARREALFTRILREAQRIAGPAFDPSALPGGDPFALLAQNAGNWRSVYDAILTGNDPLGAFRRAEVERQNGCFYSDAPTRMATMLETLWNARRMAGWGQRNDAGEPGEADDAGEPGEADDAGDVRPPSHHRDPGHEGIRREPAREHVRHEPGRDLFRHGAGRDLFRHEPAREHFRHDQFRHDQFRHDHRAEHFRHDHGLFRDYRPRPLYHLSFGRPMSHRELGRILRVVPSLQAHPEGVLRDMAGLSSQAIDVRGVDATTGEYLLAPGDTFADIAYRLVGDRARWRELEVSNPLRAEGDVRVRIPPGWFGYVPYAIPRRRVNAGTVLATVLGGPLVAMGRAFAGLFHHHRPRFLGPVAGRLFGHHYHHRGFGPVAGLFGHHPHGGFGHATRHFQYQPPRHGTFGPTPGPFGRVRRWDTAGPDDVSGEESEDAGAMHGGGSMHGGGGSHRRGPRHGGGGMHGRGGRSGGLHHGRGFWGDGPRFTYEHAPDEDPEDTTEVRSYSVTPYDASGPLSPRYTREVAEKIAGQVHGLYNGREWLRPDWWAELREVNPQKPLASNGWWRDIREGENLGIPGYWPMPESDSAPDAGEASGPLDFLSGLNPFGSGVLAAKVPAQHPRFDEPSAPAPEHEYAPPPDAWNPADFGDAMRRNSGPRLNLTHRTYVVKKGDWPVRIAKAFGATARPHWLTELERANPHKPVDSGIGNWFSLSTGETINLPDAWGAANVDTGGDEGEDEAAGPDSDWHSLAEMEGAAPYFAPLARYFRSTPDAEGTWRSYGNTLAPQFEAVAPGEARGTILETAAAGFYVALPGASGPVGWRRATAAELGHFKPEALRQLGGITFWAEPATGIEPVSSAPETGDAEADADADAGALTHRENLTHQTYAVLRGEGMFQIAKRFGAATRPHWFAELRDVNPSKSIAVDAKTGKQVGWRSLNPGDIVNLPDAWVAGDSPHARPAPGRSPSPAPYLGLQAFPPLPEHGAYPSPTAPPGTTPAGATVDPGTILRVQGILVAFRHAHPAEITPANFGDGLPVSQDCLGVLTPRTQQALSSFQTWSNTQGRYPMAERRSLRTDGVLDPATIAALDSFSAQALGGLAQRPPVLSIPGALPPRRGDTALATSVIGAATTAADDFARGAAQATDAVPDRWADVFRSSSPPAGVEVPPRKPGSAAPLKDLPNVLDRNGAPGVPSLPPGAPHGKRGSRRASSEAPVPTASLQVPPETYDRSLNSGSGPSSERPPAKSPKDDDGVLLPMALAGLSLFSGII
jgi:hypothetical protein